MFVVTGTPRSATGYASLMFSALNIPCSHEQVFRPRSALQDILKWYEAGGDRGESCWMAWVFLGCLPGPITVLHTVRDPWQVVDSLAHRNDLVQPDAVVDRGKAAMRDVIRVYCPEVYEHDNAIDRAAAMVVHWNRRIEEAVERNGCTYHRYRVEDVDGPMIRRMLGWLDLYRDQQEIDRALTEVPRNVNAGRCLEHNIRITNPEILAVIKAVAPEREPVIQTAMRTDRRRTPDELEANMNAELCEELNALAERYGYQRQTGDLRHGSEHECTTV